MTTKRQPDETEGPRGFGVVLNTINDGALIAELAEQLQKLNGELHDHAINAGGKAKGELILKLKISVEDSGLVSVDPEVTSKGPKPKRSRQIFWLTNGNNLTPHNPRQRTLPLHEVPTKNDPAREVAAADKTTRSV